MDRSMEPPADPKPQAAEAFYEGVLTDFIELSLQTSLEQRRIAREAKARYRSLFDDIPVGLYCTTPEGQILEVNQAMAEMLGYPDRESLPAIKVGYVNPGERRRWKALLEREGVVRNFELQLRRRDGTIIWVRNSARAIRDAAGRVVSYEGVVEDITERKQAEKERDRAFQEIQRRAADLEALASLSSALRVARTVAEMVPIFLEKATETVAARSGSLFLVEPQTGDLVAQGWYPPHPDLVGLRYRPGEGITGHVAATGEVYISPDLHRDPRAHILPQEVERLRPIRSCISLPLRTRERIVGVMHIGTEGPGGFPEEKVRLLTAIAEMAGNAIHRASLHEQLTLAYDTTIEGWSHALDLRDKETEGHSRRVTEMTLRLAQAMGMSDAEMVHVRRGALLHDIGKMAIPDAILLKPGPLGEEEWEIMRRHPTYAYELLSPIAFLGPALDIPYCHHEKWDGTGYPRGLRGKQIPLAARIFAIVDVWDALRSDRPYRQGWPEEKVLRYIQEEADRHFDPRVAEMFLQGMDAR